MDEMAQSADKEPRRVTLRLRPQDSSLVEGFGLEDSVSLAARGIVKDISMNEYGVTLSLELDNTGLFIKKPEPENFIGDVKELKVLKG